MSQYIGIAGGGSVLGQNHLGEPKGRRFVIDVRLAGVRCIYALLRKDLSIRWVVKFEHVTVAVNLNVMNPPAGHKSRTRRRAKRRGAVGILEYRSRSRHASHVWRDDGAFVRVAISGAIKRVVLINHQDKHVGRRVARRSRESASQSQRPNRARGSLQKFSPRVS